jgi:hypothetical protein
MTAMRKIWATRVNNTTAAEYVGYKGTIFFDEPTGALRISDGVTVGGQPLTLVASDFNFQFGDFLATTETDAPFGASLSSANTNQDINIVSNGSGSINVIGEFNVYKPDGDVAGAMSINPIFTVKNDGQVQMLVPGADSSEGAVTIVGGLDGVFQAPVNTGVMLHITGIAGTPGVPSRVYNDSQNAFSAFVARRYNNTAASPSAVLANEEIMRLSGTAHNGTLIPGTANQRIVYTALGNQTLTNQGGAIEFWTTPVNTTTLAKIATVSSTGITLESGKVFTGNVIGKHVNGVRDAGTISAGGTLTIDFATDSIVYCVWGDGMTINYQNYTAGSVVKVIARKATGSGVDTFSLDGITAANVSSGSTTSGNVSADTTAFIEFTCVGTTIGTVYAKL